MPMARSIEWRNVSAVTTSLEGGEPVARADRERVRPPVGRDVGHRGGDLRLQTPPLGCRRVRVAQELGAGGELHPEPDVLEQRCRVRRSQGAGRSEEPRDRPVQAVDHVLVGRPGAEGDHQHAGAGRDPLDGMLEPERSPSAGHRVDARYRADIGVAHPHDALVEGTDGCARAGGAGGHHAASLVELVEHALRRIRCPAEPASGRNRAALRWEGQVGRRRDRVRLRVDPIDAAASREAAER